MKGRMLNNVRIPIRSVRNTTWGVVLLLFGLTGVLDAPVSARDLLPQKEQKETQSGEIEVLALDQSNWKRPQSIFSWVAMARGYETPWDSVGRQGWMTQDAYVKPVDPGVSVFSPDTPVLYIVFEIPPLDAPGKWGAAWFSLSDGKSLSEEPVGTDAMEMDWNEKYGYFELYAPEGGWKKGAYLVKLYFGSPGQQLHAANMVGTMQFTVTDEVERQGMASN